MGIRGFLGLGSNIGDRYKNLSQARSELDARDISVQQSSSVYQTEPVGEITDQRDFYNACLSIVTELEPLDLLSVCKKIEVKMGRKPSAKDAPRPIDIDVLYLEGVTLEHPRLTLPHPELLNRRFVIVPLLELEPALTIDFIPLQERLAALPDERVDIVHPPI